MNIIDIANDLSKEVAGYVDGVFIEAPPMWIADKDYDITASSLVVSVLVPLITKKQHMDLDYWVTDENVRRGAVEVAPKVFVYSVPWMMDVSIPRQPLSVAKFH